MTRPLSGGFSPWLEALRGGACLSVVLFHSGLKPGDALPPVLHAISRITIHGWLGVSVFFALSGYFIVGSVERCAVRQTGAAAFWRDRLLRIYPAFWIAYVCAGLLAMAATPFNGLPPSSAWPAGPTAWMGDLSLTGLWFGINPRLLVSWSLDYEIAFYVLAGLVLAAPLGSPFARLAGFAVITLAAHAFREPAMPLLGLWPQFAAGVAVRYASNTTLPAPGRLACLAYPAALLGISLLSVHPGNIAATLAAFVILVATRYEHRAPRPPGWLVATGAASYSIYLAHIPVMSPLRNLCVRFVDSAENAFIVVWVAQITAGVAAGFVFHRLVESRCEQARRKLAGAP